MILKFYHWFRSRFAVNPYEAWEKRAVVATPRTR